jgi:hypothetical protein
VVIGRGAKGLAGPVAPALNRVTLGEGGGSTTEPGGASTGLVVGGCCVVPAAASCGEESAVAASPPSPCSLGIVKVNVGRFTGADGRLFERVGGVGMGWLGSIGTGGRGADLGGLWVC